jgi:transcription antitermination factor NusG
MLISAVDPRPYWFLLRTKAKQEGKALGMLDARGIVSYCPRMLEPHRRPWEPKGPVPLFPGYVFAFLPLADHRAAAQYCPGGAGFVRFGEAFAALEEETIEALRSREEGRGYILIERPRKELRPGSRVRVVGGVLSGIEGIVSRYMRGRERVKLLLTLTSGVRAAEVAANSVRCA